MDEQLQQCHTAAEIRDLFVDNTKLLATFAQRLSPQRFSRVQHMHSRVMQHFGLTTGALAEQADEEAHARLPSLTTARRPPIPMNWPRRRTRASWITTRPCDSSAPPGTRSCKTRCASTRPGLSSSASAASNDARCLTRKQTL